MPALFSRASDRSSAGAHYTGLAVEGPPVTSAPYLYGANATGEIDVFDKNFNLVNSFAADSSPTPFTPYGIRAIGDKLYVTYAAPPPVAFGGIADVCDLSTSPTVHLHKTPNRWSLQFPHAKSCPERPLGLGAGTFSFWPAQQHALGGQCQ